MKTVLVFGTFDILHPGHKWFLKKAARHGNRLIAVVSRDKFVQEWKGVRPLLDENARIQALQSSGLVDSAVLSDPAIRTYGVVQDLQPDVICLGHDQISLAEDLRSWLATHSNVKSEIQVLKPWRRYRYSSSKRNEVLRGANTNGRRISEVPFFFLMVLAMTSYGFSWVSGKRISAVADPGVLSFLRFAITALFFLPLQIRRRSAPVTRRPGKSGWVWTAIAAAFITGYNMFFFLGIKAGLAGKGSLIVTTLNPLFTFLIVAVFNRKHPGIRAIIGLVMGLSAGIILMEIWQIRRDAISDAANLYFLVAALCWSLLTLSSRKAQENCGARRFGWNLYMLASLFSLPLALLSGDSLVPAGANLNFWLHLVFISAVVGTFGTGMYFVASQRLGPARGSAFTFLVPVSALVFTAVFLGERPDILMLAGGFLGIGSVLVINFPLRRKSSHRIQLEAPADGSA